MGVTIDELLGAPTTSRMTSPNRKSTCRIDATADLLGEHVGRVKDAVQPGRRIATLRHRELGMSVNTAVISPHV